MKTCPSCSVAKNASEFGPNRSRKDGLAFYCRKCSRDKARIYAKTPRQQSRRKAWLEANRDKVKRQAQERWQAKKDQYTRTRKTWEKENRDQLLGYYRDKGAAHRAFVDRLKEGKPCLDCGRVFAPYVMEYDHVRGTKRYGIGQMAHHRRELVLAEIAKCELVCCACHRVRSHARRKLPKTPRLVRFHAWIREMKTKPCRDCGEVQPPEAMDFDHVHGEKVAGIAQMWSWGRDKVLAEVAKCELVCANCHRERTVQTMREAA